MGLSQMPKLYDWLRPTTTRLGSPEFETLNLNPKPKPRIEPKTRKSGACKHTDQLDQALLFNSGHPSGACEPGAWVHNEL